MGKGVAGHRRGRREALLCEEERRRAGLERRRAKGRRNQARCPESFDPPASGTVERARRLESRDALLASLALGTRLSGLSRARNLSTKKPSSGPRLPSILASPSVAAVVQNARCQYGRGPARGGIRHRRPSCPSFFRPGKKSQPSSSLLTASCWARLRAPVRRLLSCSGPRPSPSRRIPDRRP